MKYVSNLHEATFIKRSFGFLTQAVQINGKKIMLRCGHLGPMSGCDVLGSKIWYSDPYGYNCLPTWELVEVDGGNLVCVNQEIVKFLVIESIKKGNIHELAGYKISHFSCLNENQQYKILWLEKNNTRCCVIIENVVASDFNNEIIFPIKDIKHSENINYLLNMKPNVDRCILLYCVMHAGVETFKINQDLSHYNKLIQQALNHNIEILAYKPTITMTNIDLNVKLEISTRVAC